MALTELQTTLLSILSHALAGEEAEVDAAAVDWPALYREAMAQAVFAQVYHSLEPCIPEKYRTTWSSAYAASIVSNTRIRYEHTELHHLLTEHHIPYVSLKGCSSAERLPFPILRAMGDVDFLVKKEDCARTEDILRNAGFQPPPDREHSSHLAYHRGNSTWELHWQVDGIPVSSAGDQTRAYLQDIIKTAIPLQMDEGTVLIPDTFHHGLVLLVHSAEHMINTGIGLRHLCDWAAFAASLSSDKFVELFSHALQKCGLWRFAQLLTQLSTQYLSIPSQAWAMENTDTQLLENMMEDIFAGGNFGKKDHQRINQAKFMTNHKKGSVDNTSIASQFIATMNEKATIVLPASHRHPILLPIGWLYAGGRHVLRIRQGKRPEINLSATIQGAKHRRSIYRSFHLYEQ